MEAKCFSIKMVVFDLKFKRFKIDKIWVFFLFSKVFYMLFSLLVISRFTTLGDTFRYLDAGDGYLNPNFWYNSTSFMNTVSHSLSIILGPILANIPFVLISFIGIYYSVIRLKLSNKQLITVLTLLSLPSFGIWTSIASKEAVGVFFMGIILGFVVDVINGVPRRNSYLVLFSFYLCYIFKSQYLIGIIALLLFISISRTFSLKGSGNLILLGLFFISSFIVLYVFRHEINELSFLIPSHFTFDAGSTRENTIWVNDFDVFLNAPYGMFIAFFGPTLFEASSKLTHLFAYLESSLIVVVFLYAVAKLMTASITSNKLNAFYLGVFITVTFWILFVHYPFGALNPGSAIRYRSNFYGFLVVLFYFCYLKSYKKYFTK